MQEIMAYAETTSCRRRFLLHYFGEDGGDGRYRFLGNNKMRERYLYKDVKTLLAEFEGGGSQHPIADFLESKKEIVLLKEKLETK